MTTAGNRAGSGFPDILRTGRDRRTTDALTITPILTVHGLFFMLDRLRRQLHRAARPLLVTVCLFAAAAGCANKPKPAAVENAPAAPTRLTEALDRVATAEEAIRTGDKERALIEFQRAIEINPNLTTAYMGMGDIYRMDGDYAMAEVRYGQAARVSPSDFDAQYYHGLMLHLLERLPDAIGAYLRALALKGDDFQTNLNLATAYYQLDENTQALRYARRAVELNRNDGSARLNLGAIYAALGRHGEAVNEYQQAAELMELNSELLVSLGESLAALGRYDEMANALEQAVRVDPSPAAYERLGFARFRLSSFDAAKANFQRALDLDPDYFPALNGLGVCLLNDWIGSDRRDMAAKDRGCACLRRSIQIERDQPQILEVVTRYCR